MRASSRLSDRLSRLESRPALQLLLSALFLEALIESLHRHSPLKMIVFLGTNPLAFFYGTAVLFAVLSLSLLFRKRNFVRRLLFVLLLALGVTDCIVLCFRLTPLAFIDFRLVSSVWTILTVYMDLWQIVLAAAAVLLAAVGIVLYGIRSHRTQRLPRAGLLLAAMGLTCAVLLHLLGVQIGVLADVFPNLPDAYWDFGFVYCFTSSATTEGIDEPENYSEESIDSLLAAIRSSHSDIKAEELPNLIFVQLESFIDPDRLTGIEITGDAVPHFRALKETCSTGLLTVPAIGAGTVNTEFEVLTGMNRLYFGTGEYPYKTVLQDTPCESLCFDLRELGYSSHAVHNHYGTFYDRNLVYSNLGFDTFTSLEYMTETETTPMGWATDDRLTRYILEALRSTEGRDLVYTVTVEAHGTYDVPPEEVGTLPFTVSGMETPEDDHAFAYYLTNLAGTDRFVGALTEALSEVSEPCVAVFFGDHIPALPITEEQMAEGSLLDTEYVIWANFPLDKQDEDLTSYQLSAHVLGRLGIEHGLFPCLHLRYGRNPHYEEALELLEYDLLYGDHEAMEGDVLLPTELQMGLTPVRADSAVLRGGELLVLGEGFTPWSVICADGRPVETEYLGCSLLICPDFEADEAVAVTVTQCGKDRDPLSETAQVICLPPPEEE